MLKNRARGRAFKTSGLSKNRAAQARARRDTSPQRRCRCVSSQARRPDPTAAGAWPITASLASLDYQSEPLCGILRCEPPNHHPPSARNRHDCRAGIGSAVPACHGRRGFGRIDGGNGGRYVHVGNGRRDGRRHALLPGQSSGAGRLRQVHFHDGLHVEILHRHVGDGLPSFSHRFRWCCQSAE